MRVDFLFLFEHSGYAAEPFTQRGYTTCVVDLLNTGDNTKATWTIGCNILDKEHELAEIARGARFVFGMPPCTHLAVSGRGHFHRKALENNKVFYNAAHLFLSVVRIAGTTPYAIENPVGLMSNWWRPPNFTFHPFEYGGYLPEDDVHPEYPKYIPAQDAYSKKTCLWTGNSFFLPEKRAVPKDRHKAAADRLLGGSNSDTQIIRSTSPRGFFEALAQAYCGR